MWLRLIFAIPIVLLPNVLRFDVETGIPGLNVSNLVLLLLILALSIGRGHKQPPLTRGWLTTPLLVFYAVLVLGFVMAQATRPGILGDDVLYLKNAMFYPLLYFAYRRCRQDLAGTRQLIILVMVVAAVAGLEAILQGLSYGIGSFSETRRASGPFSHDFRAANLAGVYFAMFLSMFIAMALYMRDQKLWRLAAIAGCVILTAAIMVTYSRQSYVIAIVAFALLLMRRNVFLAVIIGVLMIPAIGLLPESVTQRVTETRQQDDVGAEQLDVSTGSRLEIWAGAMQMWQEHPAGVGLNRFKQYIGQYTPRYRNYDAHNFYVLTLAELGPLGIIALFWLLWRLFTLARPLLRLVPASDSEAKTLALGFSTLVASLMLGNLYGSRLFDGAMMGSFWMLCGLMEQYVALKKNALASPDESMPATADMGLHDIGQRFPLAARVDPGKYPGK